MFSLVYYVISGKVSPNRVVPIPIEGDSYLNFSEISLAFRYTDHNGKGVVYPKYPTLDARWMPGNGYGRFVKSIDGKAI